MKCPTCRRVAAICDNTCGRCGTDLSLLKELELRICSLLEEGNMALNSELPEKARSCFEEVLKIQKGCPGALKGLAMVALLRKEYPSALKFHKLADSACS